MFAHTAVVGAGRYEAWQEACDESDKMVYTSGMQEIEAAMLKALSMIGAPEEAKLPALQRRGRSLPTDAHVSRSSVLPSPTSSRSPTFRAERWPEARTRRASTLALPQHVTTSSPRFRAELTNEERKRRASVSTSTIAAGPSTVSPKARGWAVVTSLLSRIQTDDLEETAPTSRSPKLKQATDGHVFSTWDNAWEVIGGRFKEVEKEVVARMVQQNADPDLLASHPCLLHLFAKDRASAPHKLPEGKLSGAAHLAAVSALRSRKMSDVLRAPSAGQANAVVTARTGKISLGGLRHDRLRTQASRLPAPVARVGLPAPGWALQRRTIESSGFSRASSL